MSPRVHALLTEQDKWQGFREHVVLVHNYDVLQKSFHVLILFPDLILGNFGHKINCLVAMPLIII